MTDEELTRFYSSLDVYELLIYGLLLIYKEKNKKCILKAIHADAIEYIIRNRVNVNEGDSTIKALKKLATFDKTTQEWSLKSIETLLQENSKSKKSAKHPLRKRNSKPKKNLTQKHS